MEIPNYNNFKEWSSSAKKFWPFFFFVIFKIRIFLVLIFIMSCVFFYALNLKIFHSKYVLIMMPNFAWVDKSDYKLGAWNDFLEEYVDSRLSFQNKVVDDFDFDVTKKKFSVVIDVSFQASSQDSLAEHLIKCAVNSFEISIPKDFSIVIYKRPVSLDTTKCYQILIFSAAVAIVALLFSLLIYSFNDRIYSVEQMGLFGPGFLGIMPWVKDISFETDKSLFSEAAIQLYSALMNKKKIVQKIILFTSAIASEGKSTISFKLACVAAEFGNKVLVLECDLRRPKLHVLVDLPIEPGLTNYLTTPDLPLDEIIIEHKTIPNLFVINSGTIPRNPFILIEDVKLTRTLQILKEKFDLIFISSPPILRLADATFLAKKSDIVINVANFEFSNFKLTNEAFIKTRELNTNTFIIANAADLNAFDNFFRFHFDGYGYYFSKKK